MAELSSFVLLLLGGAIVTALSPRLPRRCQRVGRESGRVGSRTWVFRRNSHTLNVVPAHAGTHNPGRLLLRKVSTTVVQPIGRGVGSDIRRDDEEDVVTDEIKL